MPKLHRFSDTTVAFHCPGCQCGHLIPVSGPNHPLWQWNGSMDMPTFTPSIRVNYPANPNALEEFKEWKTDRCCHSFVTNGQIQFLTDSTHALSGRTVEIPDWE